MNLLHFIPVLHIKPTALHLINFHQMIKSSTLHDFHSYFVLSVVDMVLSDVFSSHKGICLDRSKPFQCSTSSFQVWQPLRHDRTLSIKKKSNKQKTQTKNRPHSSSRKQIFMFTVLQDHKVDITPGTGFVTFMRKFHCVTNGAEPG